MQYLAVREANYVKADSLYRSIPGPRRDTLQFPLLQAYKTGNEERKREILAAYDKSKTYAPIMGASMLLNVMYEPEHFDRLTAVGLANDMPAPIRKTAVAITARGLLEQGRGREALEQLGPLSVEDDMWLITALTYGSFYPVPRERVVAWREQVARMDSTASGEAPANQLRPHMRLYHLAVLSCRMGDFPAATAYAQRLQQLPAPPQWSGAMRDLGTEIFAQVDVESGRTAEGLRKLESLKTYAPLEIGELVTFNVPRLILRGEALYRAGRYEEALRYFDQMDYAISNSVPNVAYRLLRRAQSHDALNNREQARLLYSQFLKLYENADPDQQPLVTQVRNRLAGLVE